MSGFIWAVEINNFVDFGNKSMKIFFGFFFVIGQNGALRNVKKIFISCDFVFENGGSGDEFLFFNYANFVSFPASFIFKIRPKE